jgi:hypothetical protein
MQFLISMLINPAVLDALTDEEKAAIGEGHGRFIQALKQSGELVTTQALADPSQAAVVTVRNGQPAVTDGPFLEAKEHLGGFYLIDCEDKDRAIELAAQIPDAAIEGKPNRTELHLGDAGLQWAVSVYTLAFALLLITGARAGARFGPRRCFLAGLAAFVTASAAPSMSSERRA